MLLVLVFLVQSAAGVVLYGFVGLGLGCGGCVAVVPDVHVVPSVLGFLLGDAMDGFVSLVSIITVIVVVMSSCHSW